MGAVTCSFRLDCPLHAPSRQFPALAQPTATLPTRMSNDAVVRQLQADIKTRPQQF